MPCSLRHLPDLDALGVLALALVLKTRTSLAQHGGRHGAVVQDKVSGCAVHQDVSLKHASS